MEDRSAAGRVVKVHLAAEARDDLLHDAQSEAGAALLPRVETPSVFPGMQEQQSVFQHEQERSRVAYLTSRIVRDSIFRRIVLRAYDARCAITSLKLINGGGRAEVEAAHIRPVEANGPDIVSNGLALSGTAHWMFDRGLIRALRTITKYCSHDISTIQLACAL